jgi:cytochrome c peroxidase
LALIAAGVRRSWRASVTRALGILLVALSAGATATPSIIDPGAWQWTLPRGFPTPAVPADNPMSEGKVWLGRRLFFETRLSITGTYSCATCHQPERAFTDGLRVSPGATGGTTANGAMALVNIAYNVSFGWTKSHVRSLEAQMLEPLLNEHPVEMGLKGREREVAAFLSADPQYHREFAMAFPSSGGNATFDLMVKAIAAFERTLISGQSPFDHYVFQGRHDALSNQARHGMTLFYSDRLGCAACHSGFNFSGNWRDAQGVTGEPSLASNGTSATPLRIPTLRNISLTAPYMHDGRFSTLGAVIAHYEQAGRPPGHAPAEKSEPRLRSFVLDASERAALLAFLDSLTDRQFVAEFDGERTHSLPGR